MREIAIVCAAVRDDVLQERIVSPIHSWEGLGLAEDRHLIGCVWDRELPVMKEELAVTPHTLHW